MGLSVQRDYYVYLCYVYRAKRWLYLMAVSETPPSLHQNTVHALWKVQGTTSIDQAKAAVLYYLAFNFLGDQPTKPLLQDWPGIQIDRVL